MEQLSRPAVRLTGRAQVAVKNFADNWQARDIWKPSGASTFAFVSAQSIIGFFAQLLTRYRAARKRAAIRREFFAQHDFDELFMIEEVRLDSYRDCLHLTHEERIRLRGIDDRVAQLRKFAYEIRQIGGDMAHLQRTARRIGRIEGEISLLTALTAVPVLFLVASVIVMLRRPLSVVQASLGSILRALMRLVLATDTLSRSVRLGHWDVPEVLSSRREGAGLLLRC